MKRILVLAAAANCCFISLSPSRCGAPCEGTNSAGRFITLGFCDNIAEFKVVQILCHRRWIALLVMRMREI